MRTYVFFRDNTIIGVMACNDFIAMTPEHEKKLNAKGITVQMKSAEYAHHEGDVNRHVDTLLENDWLGKK